MPCLSLSLSLSLYPSLPLFRFLSRSRFRPFLMSLWRAYNHKYCRGDTARARAPVRPTKQRPAARARRWAARRPFNQIFETEHESKQEMSCRSRKWSGERGRERERESQEGEAELGCLVCLSPSPRSTDVLEEIRVERGVGLARLGGYLLISPRDRPTVLRRQFAVKRYHSTSLLLLPQSPFPSSQVHNFVSLSRVAACVMLKSVLRAAACRSFSPFLLFARSPLPRYTSLVDACLSSFQPRKRRALWGAVATDESHLGDISWDEDDPFPSLSVRVKGAGCGTGYDEVKRNVVAVPRSPFCFDRPGWDGRQSGGKPPPPAGDDDRFIILVS